MNLGSKMGFLVGNKDFVTPRHTFAELTLKVTLVLALSVIREKSAKERLDTGTSGSEGRRIVGGGSGHGGAVSSLIGNGANITLVIEDRDRVPGVEETVGEEDLGTRELKRSVVGGGPGGVREHVLDAKDVLAEVNILKSHIREEDGGSRVSDLEEAELSALLEIPSAVNVTETELANGGKEGFVGEGGANGRSAVHSIVGVGPTEDGIGSGANKLAGLVQLVSRRVLPLSSGSQELSDGPLEHELVLFLKRLASVEVSRKLGTALGGHVQSADRLDGTLSSINARRRSNVAKVLKELGKLGVGDDRSRRRDGANNEVGILGTEPSRQATRVGATKDYPGASVLLLHRFNKNRSVGHGLLGAQIAHVVGRHIVDRVRITIVAVLQGDVTGSVVLGPSQSRNLLEIEELDGSFTSKEDYSNVRRR